MSLKGVKYFNFKYPFSGIDDDYGYVRLPFENNGGKRVLFVLDWLPGEDLKSGRLLSGATGDLLGNLVALAKTKFCDGRVADFSWSAISHSAYRTIGKSKEYQKVASENFNARLNSYILRYKPDIIVAFGRSAINACIPEALNKSHNTYSNWLGVPVESTFKKGAKSHTARVFSNLSLDYMLSSNSGPSMLIGYSARCLANALLDKHQFKVDGNRLQNHKSIVIDSIEKFKSVIKIARREKFVAFDTEAKNLNIVTNKLLTIQFSWSEDYGYILPIYHKDSPFTAKELEYIKTVLRDYFEDNNENDYHIYVNAAFDLKLLKASLGIRHFKNDVWDIIAGEFALDENMKIVKNAMGSGYYSLGNLSVQYGFDGYLTAEFSKSDRANMEATNLEDKAVQFYMSADVTVPVAIHKQQIAKAKFLKYDKYQSVVRYQLSDTIHGFAEMEYNGSPLDTEYLFFLRTPESPIVKVITEMEEKLYSSKAAVKANKILCKQRNIPVTGWRGTTARVLKLSKPDSKSIFFFKVLKLKPIELGASGEGKVDKAFQKAYASVPEVSMYTDIEKAKKLRNAYVKSFINRLGEDEDMRFDNRIRPRYSYIDVVTYRTACKNP